MVTRLGRLVALPALVLTALLALPAGPAGAAGTADGPQFEAPSIGDCHVLTPRQAGGRSDSTAPVPCRQSHTARTVAVTYLPKKQDWGITDIQLFKLVLHRCYPDWAKTVGQDFATRHLSAYDYIWFVPGKTQRAHGARWIRCDAVLWAGRKLGALPTDRVPALRSTTVPDNQARCLQAKTFYTTTCDRGHALRATGTFAVASTRFPGKAALTKLANRRCPDLVSSREFTFTWRDKLTWRIGGDHTVVCYSQTSS